MTVKLFEVQRPVVECAGQPESVVHQGLFSGTVSGIHGTYLRQCDMAFIDDQEKVFREVIQQSVRHTPRRSAGENTGIVLNAAAKADLFQHLHVVLCPLLNTLCLNQLVMIGEPCHSFQHLPANLRDGFGDFFAAYHIVRCRQNRRILHDGSNFTGDDIDLTNAVDFISEIFYTDCLICGGCRKDLHHIATHPKLISDKVDVVSLILNRYQFVD